MTFTDGLRLAAAPPRSAICPRIQTAIAAAVVALAMSAQAQVAVDAGAPVLLAAGPTTQDEIRALDKQVQTVLTEARRQQELLAVQRDRLARAETANAWLALALVALGGLAGWLAWRLWQSRRQQAQAPVPAPPAAPAPDDDPAALDMAALVAAAMPDGLAARGSDRPLLSTPAVAVAPPDRTALQPRQVQRQRDSSGVSLSARDFSMGTGVPPRPVSVEELLDLEQQADFFLALGQAQSAIDLLLGHVRASGGASAPPYFKLLEIYRQQGDEEAHERTRERFNQRFNAHAPDWQGDLAGGRLLEDYPDVLQRLQRAWPQPIRAVAEMEGLLLRRADLEPFDMPAYRELLMLHALVRDMPASPVAATSRPPAAVTAPAVPSVDAAAPAVPGDAVDLLLPLGEEPLDITAPRPHLAEQSNAQAMLADWVFSRAAQARGVAAADKRPTAAPALRRSIKLDLDLSEHAPAPREFTRPAAFTDIDMRRDKRLSDLGGLDETDIDSGATPLPSRR